MLSYIFLFYLFIYLICKGSWGWGSKKMEYQEMGIQEFLPGGEEEGKKKNGRKESLFFAGKLGIPPPLKPELACLLHIHGSLPFPPFFLKNTGT